jgi:hypothetical protein
MKQRFAEQNAGAIWACVGVTMVPIDWGNERRM